MNLFRMGNLPSKNNVHKICTLCSGPEVTKILDTRDSRNEEISLYGCKICGAIIPDYHLDHTKYNETEFQIAHHSNFWKTESMPDLDLAASQAMQLVREIAEFVGTPTKAGLIVDLGAGRGNILHAMRRAGYDAIGCEASSSLAEMARRAFSLSSDVLKSEDIELFLESSVLSERKISVILLWHILEHLKNPKEIFERIVSVSDECAFFFIELPLPTRENIFPAHLFLATPKIADWIAREFSLTILNIQMLPKRKFIRIVLTRNGESLVWEPSESIKLLLAQDWTKAESVIFLYETLLSEGNAQKKDLHMNSTKRSTEIYLHIGFHKTGTSALQEYFFENRIALREAGILYPQSITRFPSHIEIAAALLPDEINWVDEDYDRDLIFDRYRRMAKEAPRGTTILLSTEELCRIDQRIERLEYIRDRFEGIKVNIVAYRRDPLDFLVSLYHHAIRKGSYDGTFAEYLKQTNLRVADFDQRLKGWKQVFGNENVIVHSYETVSGRQQGKDIVTDMFEIMGQTPPILTKTRRVNIGIHPWLREAYCALTSADLDDEKRALFRRKLLNIGAEFPRANGALFYLGEDNYEQLKKKLTSW